MNSKELELVHYDNLENIQQTTNNKVLEYLKDNKWHLGKEFGLDTLFLRKVISHLRDIGFVIIGSKLGYLLITRDNVREHEDKFNKYHQSRINEIEKERKQLEIMKNNFHKCKNLYPKTLFDF